MAFSHRDPALTLDSKARALTLLLLTVPAGGFNFEKKEPVYRSKEFPSEKELRRKDTNTVVRNF